MKFKNGAKIKGSSPLTRGKHGQGDLKRKNQRLIPAHAGKTPSRLGRQKPRTAHPRSRGENVPMRRPRRRGKGSSPLTRGKHHQEAQRADQDRLIPAHAGKTSRAVP